MPTFHDIGGKWSLEPKYDWRFYLAWGFIAATLLAGFIGTLILDWRFFLSFYALLLYVLLLVKALLFVIERRRRIP